MHLLAGSSFSEKKLTGSIVMMARALAAISSFSPNPHEIILSKTHVISPTKTRP
jgi:hypothetical protein